MRHLVIATTHDELLATVRDCDRRGEPCLVLGGGSNVLVGDNGFDGTVVRVATSGLSAEVSSCGGALVTVAAGQVWDDFVVHAIEQEWIGPEFLSGIPGLVGSTPIQNVGAYGVEVGSLSRGCVRGTASTILSALLPLTNVISGIALAVSRLSPIATSSSTSPCNSTSVPALCQSATPN